MKVQKTKQRMCQHLRIQPQIATADVNQQLIRAMEILLAQLARNEVRKHIEEGRNDK